MSPGRTWVYVSSGPGPRAVREPEQHFWGASRLEAKEQRLAWSPSLRLETASQQDREGGCGGRRCFLGSLAGERQFPAARNLSANFCLHSNRWMEAWGPWGDMITWSRLARATQMPGNWLEEHVCPSNLSPGGTDGLQLAGFIPLSLKGSMF